MKHWGGEHTAPCWSSTRGSGGLRGPGGTPVCGVGEREEERWQRAAPLGCCPQRASLRVRPGRVSLLPPSRTFQSVALFKTQHFNIIKFLSSFPCSIHNKQSSVVINNGEEPSPVLVRMPSSASPPAQARAVTQECYRFLRKTSCSFIRH